MKRSQIVFAVLAVAYGVYLIAIVWRSSLIFEGERYFSVGDDAMISMRYARNLVHGYGLVWNPGERPVEGYTNLLWVFVMAAAHALPLPASKTTAVVQVLSVMLLVANLLVTRRLAEAAGAGAVGSIGAAALTALYYPFTWWSLSGSELPLLVLAIAIAVTTAVRNVTANRFSSVPYWILGTAILVRLDMCIPYAGLLAGLAAFDRSRLTAHAGYGTGVLVLCVGIQTAFRLGYYGEWLPNTYYLKMTGYPVLWRIAWGIRDLAGFVWHRNWMLFALAAVALYRRRPAAAIVAVVAAAQFAYVAYVCPADSRFTSLAMPLVFILAALGMEMLARAAAAAGSATRRQNAFTVALVAAVAVWTLKPDTFAFRSFPGSVRDRNRALEDLTTPQARVAVAAAGTLYYLDRPGVDLLGKNDYALARAPSHPMFRSFHAGYVSGHMKWDYAYSIGVLAPDVVAELWRRPEDAAPYLTHYEPVSIGDETIYFRRGSPRIRWDRLSSRRVVAAQQ